VNVELESDDEEQQGDANPSEQIDFFVVRHKTEASRPGEHADEDERDDEREPKPEASRADHGGGQERHGDLGKGGLGHARLF
jgi:hypothetical protein